MFTGDGEVLWIKHTQERQHYCPKFTSAQEEFPEKQVRTLKTGKLNVKSWKSNSKIVLRRTSSLPIPSGSLLGFLGIILLRGDLSGACQYQRRICPSPRYSKNPWKCGFKTCGWLTKSSVGDVKYCHLTAFWEISHINWIGSLEFSRQSMQMKIDTSLGNWKRKGRAGARSGMNSALGDGDGGALMGKVPGSSVCSASLAWINTPLAVHHCQENCHFSRAPH